MPTSLLTKWSGVGDAGHIGTGGLVRLNRAYQQLEGFNADVAHELRTPLATLIGETELALSRQRDVAELRDVLGSNLEDLQLLAGLVNDMLFLSRADRGERARRHRVDSLAELVSEVIEFHEASMQEAGVTARLRGDGMGTVDAGLVRRALSNLLANATRFAERGSVIEVDIKQDTDGRNRSLSGVLCPPAPTRNNPSHIHQGGAGSDQGDSDQQQVAAA